MLAKTFLILRKVGRCRYPIWPSSVVINPVWHGYRILMRNHSVIICQNLNNAKQLLPIDKRSTTWMVCRWKRIKKPIKQEVDIDSDDDDEEESDTVDEVDDKISKVMSTTVSSLRVDLILRAGLGLARNKVETVFYESKIRVNGKKILKKSYQCQVADEVDIVRGPSPQNDKFLVVSRVEILSATEKGEKMAVKLRRYKSLTVENYEDPWKSEQEEQ